MVVVSELITTALFATVIKVLVVVAVVGVADVVGLAVAVVVGV